MQAPSSLLGPGIGGQARIWLPAFALGAMALEYGFARLSGRRTHDLAESGASIGVAIGQNLFRALEAGLISLPYGFAYAHRLLTFDALNPLAILALFIGVEFFYYWQHRAAHRIRWFWASHSVHHSSTRFNLTAAIRLGWTAHISGAFVFLLPLAWIGFHPFAILAMMALNLAYQFFIHTELVRQLGPLEWVLNTPAHHRVHHASNPACLDRNYGGVLIVFDRLFGTFAAAPGDQPLRYGLVGEPTSLNPLRIALGEWLALFNDLRRATTVRAVMRALFAPPGAGRTSALPGD